MGKGYLIDSNIIIAYLDNKLSSTAMEMMNEIIDNIPNISVITKIEILSLILLNQITKFLKTL